MNFAMPLILYHLQDLGIYTQPELTKHKNKGIKRVNYLHYTIQILAQNISYEAKYMCK